MSKKPKKRRHGTARTQSQAPRPKRRRRINTPSLIFIGIIVLTAVVIGIGSRIGPDAPDCPRGQVWSDLHGHCH
jgi:hypothetical protein